MCKNIKISLSILFIIQIFGSSLAVQNETVVEDGKLNGYDEILTSTEIASSTENFATAIDDAVEITKFDNKYVEFPFWMNISMLRDTTDTTTENVLETTRKWIPFETPKNKTKVKETKYKPFEITTEGRLPKCAHYNHKQEFDLDKMVDVWQTAYYQLPEGVQCFKIYIKKLTDQEKNYNKNTYGNFSGRVDWSKCNLEIKSATKMDRKHFLQGNNQDRGVMDNIIIDECNSIPQGKCDQPSHLKEEVADQWFVMQNLLIMRDCDTGGILVFSRVPFQPTHKAIVDALKAFGEEVTNGRMACEDNEINNRSFNEDEGAETFTEF